MSLTNAEFAVISLLAEAPLHGYEIERLIEARGMRNWTEIGFSSIYFVLQKLEGRGLIETVGPAPASRREPRVYRLSAAGRAAHREETRRALAEPDTLYPAILLGLANWPALATGAASAALATRDSTLAGRLADLTRRRNAQEPLPAFVGAMFDYGAAMIEAERAWLSKTRKLLEGTTMEKVDFRKKYKELYNPPVGRFAIVEVPPLTYYMIDGHGDPNVSPDYARAVEALYAASYTLKFISKAELSRDYVVPPLEGIWWASDMDTFIRREKEKWSWTMMIMIPDFIDGATAQRAIEAATRKQGLPALVKLRVERLEEGTSVQTLHVGSYDAEGPVIRQLHREFLPANGLVEDGHHHEIYIGDPRKTAPERLKTVLRQPVRRS